MLHGSESSHRLIVLGILQLLRKLQEVFVRGPQQRPTWKTDTKRKQWNHWTIADFWIYVWSFLLVNGLLDHCSIDVQWKWVSRLQPLQFLSFFFRVYIYIQKKLYDMFIHFWTYWVIVIVDESTGAKWNKLASNEVLTQLTKPISLTILWQFRWVSQLGA